MDRGNAKTVDVRDGNIANDHVKVNVEEEKGNWSPLNIQLLPKSWQTHLGFDTHAVKDKDREERLQVAREHLRQHQIPFEKRPDTCQSIPPIPMVPLLGANLEEHFHRLGLLGMQRYGLLCQQMAALQPNPVPVDFSRRPGWTKYTLDGRIEEVAYPQEAALVFDVEGMLHVSEHAAACVCLGSSGSWYSWVSPHLDDADAKDHDMHKPDAKESDYDSAEMDDWLIPFGDAEEAQLFIGHNVSFDRCRIREEYTLRWTRRRFLDTLSLHSAVSGLSSQQRPRWQERKKHRRACRTDSDGEDPESAAPDPASEPVVNRKDDEWLDVSAMNSLSDAYRLHCGKELDKSIRDDVLCDRKATTWALICQHFPQVMQYCARDVQATLELFQSLWPTFSTDKCPHPATLSALLLMGSFALPVDRRMWRGYLQRCNAAHQQSLTALEQRLRDLAWSQASWSLEARLRDPWLRMLDNRPVPEQYCKPKKGMEDVRKPKGERRLFGKPAWFKHLWQKGNVHVTVRAQIVPYLLKMRWRGRPVHYVPMRGWCYLKADQSPTVNSNQLAVTSDDNGNRPLNMDGGNQSPITKDGDGSRPTDVSDDAYERIPHPEEHDANVGCLLSKLFLKSPELTADSVLLGDLQAALEAFSLWTSYRERLGEQMLHRDVLLPQTIVMGTVTRRAVERTWMTATNAKESIAGSELKTLVRAPHGFAIVGADVDSQELWIATAYGDSQFGEHGCTAVGWMTLQGRRADGTDLHSRTAQLLGMRRDDAKIFTYGRIYGAGQRYAAQLLLRFNGPTVMTPEEADAKSRALYDATKGRKTMALGKSRTDGKGGIGHYYYAGGTESFMFNALERVAREDPSRTPVLGVAISDALCRRHVHNQFMTSRVNWAVQSSAVDYLHLLLVAMEHLLVKYGIQARLLLTIHDEVRYLAREEHADRCALALQVANLWVRALFAQRLRFDNLPLSVAFFSAVDVDFVLRKDPAAPCVTPTNAQALAPGLALDIHQLLRRCPRLHTSDNGDSDSDHATLRDGAEEDYGQREQQVMRIKWRPQELASFVHVPPRDLALQAGLSYTPPDDADPGSSGSSAHTPTGTAKGANLRASSTAASEMTKVPRAKSLREMLEENHHHPHSKQSIYAVDEGGDERKR